MNTSRKTAANWLSANISVLNGCDVRRLMIGALLFCVMPFIHAETVMKNPAGCELFLSNTLGLLDTYEWIGGCRDGRAEGPVEIFISNDKKHKFKAMARNGYLYGKVNIRYPSGSLHTCEFSDGKLDGNCVEGNKIGTYQSVVSNGNEHKGRGIKEGRPYNVGVLEDGEFFNKQLHGFGRLSWPSNLQGDFLKLIESRVGGVSYFKISGDRTSVSGLWENGELKIPCSSPQNCKQEQAKREAQERREQAARDEQYRRDAPAREARERANQMCEAQKQSCKASCPAYNYDAKSFDANRTHFQCESRCSQISCN